MPPDGAWRPNISLQALLTSIRVLLGTPNLDDPVRPDLIEEWLQPPSSPQPPNSPAQDDPAPPQKRPKVSLLSMSARASAAR